MKKNNNLIKITNTFNNEIKYFTKDSYVMKYIGCSQGALALIRSNNSRAYKGYVYELVDGSNIMYKDINDLPNT